MEWFVAVRFWRGASEIGWYDAAHDPALFGAGALVPVGRHSLALELRYVQGLLDIVARDDSSSAFGASRAAPKG